MIVPKKHQIEKQAVIYLQVWKINFIKVQAAYPTKKQYPSHMNFEKGHLVHSIVKSVCNYTWKSQTTGHQ